MHLNTLKPAPGEKKSPKRVGRGIGSGSGKTCGRGHKGQRSRTGGYHKVGFEGGQMPLQRRLPKVGFSSRKSLVTTEVRLHELNCLDEGATVDLQALKVANVISGNIKRVKIILSGKVTKAVKVNASDITLQNGYTSKPVRITSGAKAAIEAAGGQVIEN